MKWTLCLAAAGAVAVACGSCHGEKKGPSARSETGSLPAAASGEPDPRPRKAREPAEAGSFYPKDPDELARAVRGYLDAAPRVVERPVRILLTPHAGLTFSGRTAGKAFKQLDKGFSRVVIIAANHSNDANYDGVSVDRVTDYEMPGFSVHVAYATEKLLGLPGFVDEPKAHTKHMIEIELPFLREMLGNGFQIVPLVVGRLDRAGTRSVAAQLQKLADGKTLFVFSVDLSHYYPYERAVALDRACLDALVRTDAEAVVACDTDGTQVLLVMNELAGRLALTPRLVANENSGDVSGDKGRVVGYGALVYEDRFQLGKEEGKELTLLARKALELKIKDGKTPEPPPNLASRWPRLGAERSVFVTLEKSGELRGCIGDLSPVEPLVDNVVHNAVNAALRDPRFPAVSADELAAISLSVSVLDVPRPLESLAPKALLERLGRDKPGVILEYQGHRSTFLPQVWKELPEPKSFLTHLCQKQSSPDDCWSSADARYQTYAVQYFAEGAEKR